eukprot:scaffold354642_cov46-Cyclotella_meneghiniana.AAC.1
MADRHQAAFRGCDFSCGLVLCDKHKPRETGAGCRRFMGVCAPIVSRGGKKGPVFQTIFDLSTGHIKNRQVTDTIASSSLTHQIKLQSQQM